MFFFFCVEVAYKKGSIEKRICLHCAHTRRLRCRHRKNDFYCVCDAMKTYIYLYICVWWCTGFLWLRCCCCCCCINDLTVVWLYMRYKENWMFWTHLWTLLYTIYSTKWSIELERGESEWCARNQWSVKLFVPKNCRQFISVRIFYVYIQSHANMYMIKEYNCAQSPQI